MTDTVLDKHQRGSNMLATVTIDSGQSQSGDIDLWNRSPLYIITPEVMDSSLLTFLASPSSEGEDFYPVFGEDGTEFQITVTLGAYISIPASFMLNARRIRLRSGTKDSPQVESDSRVLVLGARLMAG